MVNDPVSNKKLIVLVGPTAVGKTAVAIELAKHLGTEIDTADSRQIFKEMNIGTAKPSPSELAAAPHHFISSHSIDDAYDAYLFEKDALVLIQHLFKAHSRVILCGGSGLYIKAVCEGFDDIPPVAPEIRNDLIKHYEQFGLTWLQEKMKELDPGHFQSIDQNNPQRLTRALEVKIALGQSISSFYGKNTGQRPFEIIKIGLELDRAELYKKIDARMDKMIAEGLFDEAKNLYHLRNRNALQTVGYQEIFNYLEGNYDREEAIRLLKRNSRRYAKRQMTWFKRDSEVRWFQPGDLEEIHRFILR